MLGKPQLVERSAFDIEKADFALFDAQVGRTVDSSR